MYEIKTRYFERCRRVVSVRCSEEHDTFFCSEYEANIFIRNMGTYLSEYAVLHPRRRKYQFLASDLFTQINILTPVYLLLRH